MSAKGGRGDGPRRADPRTQREGGVPRRGTGAAKPKDSGDAWATRSPAPPSRRAPDPERVLRAQPWDILRPLLEAAGCDVERALARLRAYATLLLEWNRGVSNLVSHNDERRLVERHLAESLAPAPLFAALKGGRLIDLGSGSGLPALPLAIAGIGARWTLVESRRNKTLFMRKAIEEIGLKGIDVNCARLETLLADGSIGRSFDGFTSRATMAVGPTLDMAGGCVVGGGRAFLWKGSGLEAEMAAAATELRASWTHEATHPIPDTPNSVAVFVCNK